MGSVLRIFWQISYAFPSAKNFENRLRFYKVTEFKRGNFFETQCSIRLLLVNAGRSGLEPEKLERASKLLHSDLEVTVVHGEIRIASWLIRQISDFHMQHFYVTQTCICQSSRIQSHYITHCRHWDSLLSEAGSSVLFDCIQIFCRLGPFRRLRISIGFFSVRLPVYGLLLKTLWMMF